MTSIVTGYCMKSPNKHGILQEKLYIPPNEWRMVIIPRYLHPRIKRQALNHRDVCRNMDTDPDVMKRCKCHLIE